jgi:hypothetical protein
MTRRTSVANWLMLLPTSPAPIRMTMLFGSRELAWPLMAVGVTGLVAPRWVLFFERLLAMVMCDDADCCWCLVVQDEALKRINGPGQLQAGKKFRWGRAYRACPTADKP